MARSVVSSRHVYLDLAHPDVAADVVIQGDHVEAVLPYGRADRSQAGEVRDFGDDFVCPGFHDAHQHVLHTALFP
jgi:adenine deaminase